jgi:AraC-like DNA-binding protein
MAAAHPIPGGRSYGAQTLASHSPAVERVIQAMRAQINEPLSLHEMAEIAYLSPFHFNRVFRSITGVPPSEFLAALRLDAAKRLLLTTSLSVTDVCFNLGYASLGTFTQRFKQLIGLSPLQLRQLADQLTPAPLDPLRDRRREVPHLAAGPHVGLSGAVNGTITAPADFAGPIFVGLFPRPVPQGQPVACTTLPAPGPYQLAPVPDGWYYLQAAALSWSQNALTYLMPETNLLVGVVDRPVLVRAGRTSAPIGLALRPAHTADPPILGVFPPLLRSTELLADRMSFTLRKIEEAS